jgi:hypothetical protein
MQVDSFDSLADYIATQTTKGDLAAVPIPLVAEHLNVSSPAVAAMLSDGRLDGVRIGKNTLVTLSSLQARQTKRAGQESTVHKYLMKRAKEGVRAIFYEPVMAQVGMTPRVPADRTRIGGILGAISEKSYEEDGVLLSVLVHQKTAGTTRPGKGFFDLARHLGFKWTDDNKFIKDQTDKVLAAYS